MSRCTAVIFGKQCEWHAQFLINTPNNIAKLRCSEHFLQAISTYSAGSTFTIKKICD